VAAIRIDDIGKMGERERRPSATCPRESTIGDDQREEGKDRNSVRERARRGNLKSSSDSGGLREFLNKSKNLASSLRSGE